MCHRKSNFFQCDFLRVFEGSCATLIPAAGHILRACGKSPMDERYNDSTDDEQALCHWMAAYQDGSAEAFDRLYEALENELRGFFVRQCQDRGRVEDLVQETFLQLHRSRRSYLRDRPVRPWVYAIAKKVFLMYTRKIYRRERPEKTRLWDIPEAAAAAQNEQSGELSTALERLPEDGRRAFLLHHWIGMSFREIAGILGVEPGVVRLRSSRAAERLRKLLRGGASHE